MLFMYGINIAVLIHNYELDDFRLVKNVQKNVSLSIIRKKRLKDIFRG